MIMPNRMALRPGAGERRAYPLARQELPMCVILVGIRDAIASLCSRMSHGSSHDRTLISVPFVGTGLPRLHTHQANCGQNQGDAQRNGRTLRGVANSQHDLAKKRVSGLWIFFGALDCAVSLFRAQHLGFEHAGLQASTCAFGRYCARDLGLSREAPGRPSHRSW
jgi:hypothetical protein